MPSLLMVQGTLQARRAESRVGEDGWGGENLRREPSLPGHTGTLSPVVLPLPAQGAFTHGFDFSWVVCVCVCVRERERERERGRERERTPHKIGRAHV